MARKKPKAYYPTQRQIRLRDQTAAVAGGRFLQSTRLLSESNRRLYRQAYVYNLKVDVDVDSALATSGVDVYVLRNTWDLHGAYKFAMKTYYNAMKEELATAGGARTRWHDFRVKPDFQADELEPTAANPDNAIPAMVDGTIAFGSQHEFTEVIDAAGNSRTFGLDTSTTANNFSIIAEWQDKDRVQDNPASFATTLPYNTMDDENTEGNYDVLSGIGNAPPYRTDADTNLWTKVATIKQTTPAGTAKLTTGYFEAPLGLVILVSSAFTTTVQNHPMTVTFQAGDYKGVKATKYATPVMTEAKEYEVV